MKDKILSKIKTAKSFRIFLIVLAVLCFLSMIIIPMLDIVYMGIYFVLSFALVISGCVYLISFQPIVKSAKCIEIAGPENTVDDIPANPTLPKSKIYCGSKAFFSNNPFTVIPYSEIAWVYVQVNKVYGITVGKQVHIYYRNGKHFILRADVEEIKWLLENCLLKFNPNIIIGYGFEEKKQYKAVKNTYKNQF